MNFELWSRFFEHTDLYGVVLPLGGFSQHDSHKLAINLDAYYAKVNKTLEKFAVKSTDRDPYFPKKRGHFFGVLRKLSKMS